MIFYISLSISSSSWQTFPSTFSIVLHHCAAGPRPRLASCQLSVWQVGCRVDGEFGGLCNEGVQCNKCKISLTFKTKLQAKRRQSSSVRNLADSKETKKAAREGCGDVGMWGSGMTGDSRQCGRH